MVARISALSASATLYPQDIGIQPSPIALTSRSRNLRVGIESGIEVVMVEA